MGISSGLRWARAQVARRRYPVARVFTKFEVGSIATGLRWARAQVARSGYPVAHVLIKNPLDKARVNL